MSVAIARLKLSTKKHYVRSYLFKMPSLSYILGAISNYQTSCSTKIGSRCAVRRSAKVRVSIMGARLRINSVLVAIY